MAREMFGDIVKPSITVGSKQWYTLPVSILVHVVIIGALVVIPLMAADVLPTPPGHDGCVRGGAAAAATATPRHRRLKRPRPNRSWTVNPSAAPVEAPSQIKPETGIVEERVATVTGDIGGVVGGIPGGVPEAPPPPPPPPPAPVRVGGQIQAPKKVKTYRRPIRRSRSRRASRAW